MYCSSRVKSHLSLTLVSKVCNYQRLIEYVITRTCEALRERVFETLLGTAIDSNVIILPYSI